MNAEVQQVSQRLQRAEAELRTAKAALDQSQEEIQSLSRRLQQSESLLQASKSRGEEEVDAAPASISESSHLERDGQARSRPDQSSELAEGRDLSVTCESGAGEMERKLSERVTELEKEVCVCVGVCVWARVSASEYIVAL